jgi:hypothetical protein
MRTLLPLIVAAIPFAAGVAMLVRARRGDRLPPACAASGTSVPEMPGPDATCAGCGVALAETPPLPGERASRPGDVVVGIALLVLALATLGATIAVQQAAIGAGRKADRQAEQDRQRANQTLTDHVEAGRREAAEAAAEAAQETAASQPETETETETEETADE